MVSKVQARRLIRSAVFGLVIFGGSCQVVPSTESQAPAPAPVTAPSLSTVTRAIKDAAVVLSVTDGDTIRVRLASGDEEPVRLIGIDAPEDGSVLDQEATAYLEDLVLGKNVRLVVDVSDRDRFGRLLRYVYVENVFVNEEMVRAGLATARRYEPDTAMATVLEAAQGGAEDAAVGLFSGTTIGTSGTTASTPGTNCDSSYPDFCIPPPPPDLDCDIVTKNFTVRSPDPHGFDGNWDGVGCES